MNEGDKNIMEKSDKINYIVPVVIILTGVVTVMAEIFACCIWAQIIISL